MSNWDIAFLVLAIIWVTALIIEVVLVCIQLRFRDKEIRHFIEKRRELEKKIEEFNNKEHNNE